MLYNRRTSFCLHTCFGVLMSDNNDGKLALTTIADENIPMNETTPKELKSLADDYRKLIASQQTLLLSTATREGQPLISYAPYVQDASGKFFIYLSELASHTTNLTNNPQASIMFICPEAETGNLFARPRVIFNCCVTEIVDKEAIYISQLRALQTKFGEVVGILRSLPDFHLFALHPQSGHYVAGFGRTHLINVSDGELTPVQSQKQ